MRVLILGGTGLIGAALARTMTRQGHAVAIFHRGPACEVDNGLHIHGERQQLEAWADRFADFSPHIVVDTIAASASAVRQTLAVFGPIAPRIVLISSMDVYRAWGVFHGTELGAPDPVPLHESSPLRRHAGLFPASTLNHMREVHGWMEAGYDKMGMERAAAAWPNSAQLTVVRLAPVFGPGDRQLRLYPYWRRMADQRPALLLQRGWAQWRSPRLYVANAAAGIALAATATRAAGRVYNLAAEVNYSELEWAQLIARALDWNGRFLITSPESTPAPLRVAARTAQSLAADTRRIRQELNYSEPVPLTEALHTALAWERAHTASAAPIDYTAENQTLMRLGWSRLATPIQVPAAAPVPAPSVAMRPAA